MIPAGPAVERGAAIALALLGGGALCWLQARVGWLEQTTAERDRAVRFVEELRNAANGMATAPVVPGDWFPGHEVHWQRTIAGPRLVVRPRADREKQR